jgi:hypothetical protein
MFIQLPGHIRNCVVPIQGQVWRYYSTGELYDGHGYMASMLEAVKFVGMIHIRDSRDKGPQLINNPVINSYFRDIHLVFGLDRVKAWELDYLKQFIHWDAVLGGDWCIMTHSSRHVLALRRPASDNLSE